MEIEKNNDKNSIGYKKSFMSWLSETQILHGSLQITSPEQIQTGSIYIYRHVNEANPSVIYRSLSLTKDGDRVNTKDYQLKNGRSSYDSKYSLADMGIIPYYYPKGYWNSSNWLERIASMEEVKQFLAEEADKPENPNYSIETVLDEILLRNTQTDDQLWNKVAAIRYFERQLANKDYNPRWLCPANALVALGAFPDLESPLTV